MYMYNIYMQVHIKQYHAVLDDGVLGQVLAISPSPMLYAVPTEVCVLLR